MKIAYFDCFAGVAGDMILGALVDAGVVFDDLKAELAKLNVDGFDLTAEKIVKHGIAGTKINVVTEEQKAHRHLHHIVEIINDSSLAEKIKDMSIAIFENLAKAEAKVHNTTLEKIHFHEVGALDAIVDIVGAVIGLDLLGIEGVYASKINTGQGFVECEHGTVPVPAPATLELLTGLPVYSTGIEKELTTPTGAAILSTLVDQFGNLPEMTITAIGYGAGTRELEIPNMVRMLIGELDDTVYETDCVALIETNIDDMNPQIYDYLLDRLYEKGALEVYMTPIIMKKNRPSMLVSVLSPDELVDELSNIIFKETTTIGIRMRKVERKKLYREIRSIETEYGSVRIKISFSKQKMLSITPEYDDCKKIAEESGTPLNQLLEEIRRIAEITLKS